MGFQYRKRTKGKNAWFNFSASKKRGVGTSFSFKLGNNITCNSRGRLTVNLGNGLRYVAYKKKKKQPKPIVNKTSNYNLNYNYKGIASAPLTPEERRRLVIKSNVIQYNRYQREYEVCKSCLMTLSESRFILLDEDKRVFAKLAKSLDAIKEDEVRNINTLIATINQLRKMEVLVDDVETKDFVTKIRMKLEENQNRVTRKIASEETNLFSWPVIVLIIAACFVIQTCSS